MAVARLLRGMGRTPLVMMASDPEGLSGDAALQYARLHHAGVACRVLSGGETPNDLIPAFEDAGLVVDALLGTGLSGPVKGFYAGLITAVNASAALVASIDIPSGLPGGGLKPLGPCVYADLTLTLALSKPVLHTPEGEEFCGRVRVLDIGIPPEATARVNHAAETLEGEWAAPFFTARPRDANKGRLGRVLIVAGSRGKSGAAILAARGALRAGAGLVTVGTPLSAQPAVTSSLPEVMTLPLPETPDGTLSMDALLPVLSFCEGVDAVGMGPGLGTTAETQALVRELYRRIGLPMVVDADGLNAFASHEHGLPDHEGLRMLTPHPGEMARLTGLTPAEVVGSRYELGPRCAAEWKAVVLLKGYRSLVCAPGQPWRINLSGGAHMAGPGFGDVLTGIVSSLAARGMDPLEATSLGAWWHGAAADLASDRLGGYGLLASEAADALPAVEGTLRAR
jgi:hydroxyethylthiazole kinase-like uncharacterized protein yjeF